VALEGRRIVLGVSGGIAAYKAVEVCRRLVDAGAHVAPVLTEGALRFVGRTTFDALGSEPAHTSLWDDPSPIPHTRLGQGADLVVVAPATARVLGLYAAGISEDLLTNVLLATRAPVLVAPAMHTEMWEHAAVQDNLRTLRSRGVHVIEPGVGRLAGGDVGAGRLAEPADIVAAAEALLGPRDLVGLKVLVTAGGTREPIDPVRFISNRSSGKQGHAIATEAAARGAEVTLVTTTGRPAAAGVEVVRVETAAELADAVLARSDACDVVVMAAAVADFRPVASAAAKLQRGERLTLELEPTEDILAEVAARARELAGAVRPVLVGFAAETGSLERAAEKLRRKGVDLLVANDVSEAGSGFGTDTNRVVILDAGGGRDELPLLTKREVADRILDRVARALDARDASAHTPRR